MANNRYWETEKPTIIQTCKSILIHYPQAGKLQVCQSYKNAAGDIVPGKRGTLDLEDIALNPEALELLQNFINEARTAC